MGVYAKETSVPVERSRAEIESILSRYGATAFGYMADQTRAMIQFQAQERRIRFILPMPDPADKMFTRRIYRGQQTYGERPEGAARAAWEQACRQRWRALALAVKAKLEAVQSGITTFEDEFMAHIVLPGGKTVSEMVKPGIEVAYKEGKVPNLLAWDGNK